MSSLDHNSSSSVTIQISLTDLEQPEAEQLISHLHRYLAESKLPAEPNPASSLSIIKLPAETVSSTDIAIDALHTSKLKPQTAENLNSKLSLPKSWYKYIDKTLFLIAFGYLTAVAAWLNQPHSKPLLQRTTHEATVAAPLSSTVVDDNSSTKPASVKLQSVVPVYLPDYWSDSATVEPLKSNYISGNTIALQPPVQPIFIPTPVSNIKDNQPQTSSTTVALQPPVTPVASPIPTPPPPSPSTAPIKTSIGIPSTQTTASQPVAKVDSTNISSNSSQNNQTDEMPTATKLTSVKTDNNDSATSSPLTGTLIGMLTLGENSAALFSVNGISHRATIGEKIGNTDWILQAVETNSVKISSQQHSRTITVGEKF